MAKQFNIHIRTQGTKIHLNSYPPWPLNADYLWLHFPVAQWRFISYVQTKTFTWCITRQQTDKWILQYFLYRVCSCQTLCRFTCLDLLAVELLSEPLCPSFMLFTVYWLTVNWEWTYYQTKTNILHIWAISFAFTVAQRKNKLAVKYNGHHPHTHTFLIQQPQKEKLALPIDLLRKLNI